MTQLVHVSTTGKQNYGTPQLFVNWVGFRFGLDLVLDLAADFNNKKCFGYISENRDSLTLDWKSEILSMKPYAAFYPKRNLAGWLNPPFKQNPAFAKKAHQERDNGARFASLTLSSLGTNWFKDHFKNNALNFILEDRMVFEGEPAPYPKELMLSIWGTGMNGICWLSFKESLKEYINEAFKIAA
jgi:DNA N-6-adenine-methyltransferase Dam